MANPYRMAACVSRLKMPRYFMSWCRRMAWRIQRWCLPALARAVSIRSLGVRQARVGIILGHYPTPLITIDLRVTIDRHGTFYVGEDQVVEFVGDDLRGRTPRQRRTKETCHAAGQTGYSLIDGTVFGRRRAPTAARVAFLSAARRRKKFVHSARPQGRRSNRRSAARTPEMSRSDM